MEEERNGFITFASLKEHKERLVDEERENLEPQPECCIYRVPKAIRKADEEAYTPQVISIGPLHHDKEELAYMEKQKIRYRREFSERITPETWQEFVTFLQNHEQRIRNCYEETPRLGKLEFTTMILYDAVFIIEWFLRYYEWIGESTTALPYNTPLRVSIRLDLEMLENQLPYFVLEELYMIAFPSNIDCPSFFYLSCLFFEYFNIGNYTPIILGRVDVQLKHFTDLNRYLLTMRFSRPECGRSNLEIPCAVKLQESGVRFKLVERESFLNITFEKKRLLSFMPWFKVQELQIPAIKIYDTTEPLLRNLMALEQCHYPSETYICNYINLMDSLINDEEDVNLLVEAGIIHNHVGDNAKVANMFNKFCKNIVLDDFCYCDVLEDLKAHYDNPWNHAVSTLKLKRVYFNSLWRGTGTVAAILLLVLTLVQTICSIRQVV
ncbi:hypothetical protein CUMW_005880 [Citrus unshiu]|nr:hypothetical protein CUMW_005880 [Citrus unshiu]